MRFNICLAVLAAYETGSREVLNCKQLSLLQNVMDHKFNNIGFVILFGNYVQLRRNKQQVPLLSLQMQHRQCSYVSLGPAAHV